MARQIIWSIRAQEDKRKFFTYWSQHNKSNRYSKKLNQFFKDAIELIREHPYFGKSADDDSVRIKIVTDYLLIYEVTTTSILILSIWDGRQDSSKLEDFLK